MMMTFTFSMTCGSCKAELRYEDERPFWQTYDYRVEEADECERSARFVAEHADEKVPSYYEWQFSGQREGHPRFVTVVGHRDDEGVTSFRYELLIPFPYRYVECPVCDVKVREPKGKPA